MAMSASTAVFVISLTAIPITYMVNWSQSLTTELALPICGFTALSFVSLLTYMLVARKGQKTDPLYYVYTVTTFGGVVGVIIGLENDGVIEGFMTRYLSSGEPYLKTAYGSMVSYWDGIVHYGLTMMVLSALSWHQNYRDVGLYWAGSIGHSMVVFMPGNVLGKYGVRWSYALNIPYVFIPFLCCARFLRERPIENIPLQQAKSKHVGLLKRPVDIFFILSLVTFIVIACVRGFAVLGCTLDITESYLNDYEPYLKDPTTYGKVQMLVYLFYYVPYYVMAIYGLMYPEQTWMPDWALIHAGCAAQAQFSHIGSSLHHRTPYLLRVPTDPDVRLVFWAVNLSLAIIPQLLAYRCVNFPAFFQNVASSSERRKIE